MPYILIKIITNILLFVLHTISIALSVISPYTLKDFGSLFNLFRLYRLYLLKTMTKI
jgi:hypothetical protein